MKISELPPGLKEVAELRAIRSNWYQPDRLYDDHLPFLFNWDETPEGYNFWDEIDDRNFTPFYNCKVVNFKLKE